MFQRDELLVTRVVTFRDQQAFTILVERYQSKVRNYLRQLTRDPSLADDLAQETFIRAWDKMDSISSGGRFAAWLMKIAHNMFLQSYRKAKRYGRLMENLEQETTVTTPIENDPISGEGSLDMPKYLSILNEEERSVMLLYFVNDLTHSEISEVSGLPLGTVKSHIHRGKFKIREHFELKDADMV
ncbi:MAG: RNA polymerase sigma factor [Proteobacteria bacterium]|nr:RNA polymerase sigma factor [Pseudomonadota bacterium]